MKFSSFLITSILCIGVARSQVNTPAIKIGEQTWMKTNLNVATYRNGDPIPEVRDSAEWAALKTGAWCHYNNDPAYDAIYGKLYNWYAVNDPRGLAPQGWHVPGDNEWTMLTAYLGGEKVAGGKMKESGSAHWKSTNVDATNSSGFTALPGGMRQGNGKYDAVGVFGCWWSITENNVTFSWYRYLSWSYADITRYDASKRFGFSVRILKDQ